MKLFLEDEELSRYVGSLSKEEKAMLHIGATSLARPRNDDTGPTIRLVSGDGGVGKSTLVANTLTAYEKLQEKQAQGRLNILVLAATNVGVSNFSAMKEGVFNGNSRITLMTLHSLFGIVPDPQTNEIPSVPDGEEGIKEEWYVCACEKLKAGKYDWIIVDECSQAKRAFLYSLLKALSTEAKVKQRLRLFDLIHSYHQLPPIPQDGEGSGIDESSLYVLNLGISGKDTSEKRNLLTRLGRVFATVLTNNRRLGGDGLGDESISEFCTAQRILCQEGRHHNQFFSKFLYDADLEGFFAANAGDVLEMLASEEYGAWSRSTCEDSFRLWDSMRRKYSNVCLEIGSFTWWRIRKLEGLFFQSLKDYLIPVIYEEVEGQIPGEDPRFGKEWNGKIPLLVGLPYSYVAGELNRSGLNADSQAEDQPLLSGEIVVLKKIEREPGSDGRPPHIKSLTFLVPGRQREVQLKKRTTYALRGTRNIIIDGKKRKARERQTFEAWPIRCVVVDQIDRMEGRTVPGKFGVDVHSIVSKWPGGTYENKKALFQFAMMVTRPRVPKLALFGNGEDLDKIFYQGGTAYKAFTEVLKDEKRLIEHYRIQPGAIEEGVRCLEGAINIVQHVNAKSPLKSPKAALRPNPKRKIFQEQLMASMQKGTLVKMYANDARRRLEQEAGAGPSQQPSRQRVKPWDRVWGRQERLKEAQRILQKGGPPRF